MEFSNETAVNAGTSRNPPLLVVRNLTVGMTGDASEGRDHGILPLRDVSFEIGRGEVVGLLGESGAGKTTLANVLLRLLPSAFQVLGGTIEFEGTQFLSLSKQDLRGVRGARISMIHQGAAVLNPVLRVGDQLTEVLRAHFRWPREQYREKAWEILGDVGFEDIDRIYAAYPHQLSGGQKQRIVIAQALACQPALVIADEPTASLDPETSLLIVEILGRLKQRFHTAFLLISHDLAPLARLTDRIMVIYAGRIVETGTRDEVLRQAAHPYTRALLACALQDDAEADGGKANIGKGKVPTIPGSAPIATKATVGCGFEPRCPEKMSVCIERFPGKTQRSATHGVCCFKYGG